MKAVRLNNNYSEVAAAIIAASRLARRSQYNYEKIKRYYTIL